VPAATWSSIWYLLSSFAVISYTNHWAYVVFAAAGSWIGAYASISLLHPGPSYPTSRRARRLDRTCDGQCSEQRLGRPPSTLHNCVAFNPHQQSLPRA